MSKIRISDYIMNHLANIGVRHVFMVSGGGGMFLIDSLGNHPDLKFVCNHHEQASAMCAEAYSRIRNGLGVALVTTGPATTNAITGLLCAWNDSIPVIYLSGQAKSTTLIGDTGLRQKGVHEVNIIEIVKSVTKYAVTIMKPKEVSYHLEKAIFLSRNGRPGPVWLDIPLDIQGALVEEVGMMHFHHEEEQNEALPGEAHVNSQDIATLVDLIRNSKRPAMLAGNGVKLANAGMLLHKLVDKYPIPVLTTMVSFDVMHADHPSLAGCVGNYGHRCANFVMQNADLLIIVGSRLAYPVVGYETDMFAREAVKVLVEIDEKQIEHALIDVDLVLHTDAHGFLSALHDIASRENLPVAKEWLDKVAHWKEIFPRVSRAQSSQEKYVNTYYFYEVLSEEMHTSDILTWDQGAAFYSAITFKVKKDQIAFSNGGFTPMGYGLPAAIGACFAADRRQVICVHGDGGLQLNAQELQTIFHHQLPIKLFVFNNDGYLSIKHTQQSYFNGHLVGSDTASGLSCPDTHKLATGYSLPSNRIQSHAELRQRIREALEHDGPLVIEVLVDPFQEFSPRVQSMKQADGTMRSAPLEDMYPYMDRDLFKKEMIVKPVG